MKRINSSAEAGKANLAILIPMHVRAELIAVRVFTEFINDQEICERIQLNVIRVALTVHI